MNKKNICILVFGILAAVFFGLLVVQAKKEPKIIGVKAQCVDGYYTTPEGRGTCSAHGGIKRKFE